MKDMNCSRMQKLFIRLIDQELSPAEQEVVSRHLEVCPDCQKQFQLLQQDQKLLLEVTAPEISPFFTTRTLARIREVKPAAGWSRLVWQTLASLLILAGIYLGVILGSNLATGNCPDSELSALNTEPSIEELFIPENGGE